MRILHISTRLILGGSQENTVLSCEGQARAGHDVHLAFGPIYGPEGSLLERVERFRTDAGARITTHVVPHLAREINPVADARCYRELKRLIRTLEPDIVHTHSSKAGIIGRAAAWAVHKAVSRSTVVHEVYPDHSTTGTPIHREVSRRVIGVVHTIHGPPFMPVEGSLLRRLKVRFTNRVYTIAERFAARRCHAIVSVADAMTRQFLARRIGRGEQYMTVLSGMETGAYLNAAPGESRAEVRARLGLGPGDFVIGTVARLAEHKGHDDLLEALHEDLRTRPDWKLLWVGDGWWRQRLLRRARSMGLSVRELDREARSGGAQGPAHSPASPLHPLTPLPHQVILTGLAPPEQVPGLVRSMDVLAHPSYREGLPRTVPQALLAGACPVAYDVDGTGEICRDGETGRLVSLGDRDGLRGAIRSLYDHPAERAAMTARGRDECRERFSAARMVMELDRVYALALERARA